MQSLNLRGKDLLCYVMNIVKGAEKEILIKRIDATRVHPHLVGDSFYVGLCDLIDNGFLARKESRKETYYINTNYFRPIQTTHETTKETQ